MRGDSRDNRQRNGGHGHTEHANGSCIRRNAKFSQETASFPTNDAKLLLTITLICTALAAITDGTIRTRILRIPGSFHRKSGRNL